MVLSKDNKGNIIGFIETYVSNQEIVQVNAHGNFTTITTVPKSGGLPCTKTFFGKPILPSDPSIKK